MDDTERTTVFAAAVTNCLAEHEAGCIFGGFTVYSLYWLKADGCTLPHDDTCAWCGAERETCFPGWQDGHAGDDNYRYLVPACQPCGDEWARIDPRWTVPPAGE